MAALLILERQGNLTGRNHVIQDRNECGFPVRRLDITNGNNLVSELQPCPIGVRIRNHVTNSRLQHHDTRHEQGPVGDDRKQKIEQRSCGQDGYACRNRALVECPSFIFGLDRAFTTVKESYIATEGNRGNAVLGIVLA